MALLSAESDGKVLSISMTMLCEKTALIMHLQKSIDSRQPAQADMVRNFSLSLNVLYGKGLLYVVMVHSVVRQDTSMVRCCRSWLHAPFTTLVGCIWI